MKAAIAPPPPARRPTLQLAIDRAGCADGPKEKTSLVLYTTSHGWPHAGLSYKHERSTASGVITPGQLAAMLGKSRCSKPPRSSSRPAFAGQFVPALAGRRAPSSLTAASSMKSSFGCSASNDWTFFGHAFVNQALRSLRHACPPVSTRRRHDHRLGTESCASTSSNPQLSIGERHARAGSPRSTPRPSRYPPYAGRQPAFRTLRTRIFMRTLLRPTGFVNSPFGHDGKVARLAGGLNWFAQVELLTVEDGRRTGAELVPGRRHREPLRRRSRGGNGRRSSRRARRCSWASARSASTSRRSWASSTPRPTASPTAAYSPMPPAPPKPARTWRAKGAAIIDVGGESTRPGAAHVWEGDEIERVVPVIRQLAGGGAAVSIDTRKAGVMEAALGAGARLVNDVSALTFDRAFGGRRRGGGRAGRADAPPGRPADDAGRSALRRRAGRSLSMARRAHRGGRGAGIAARKILVDPGFGFGKTVAHNLELMNGLALFHGLGCPIVLGASRKRTIGALVERSAGRPAARRIASPSR